MTSDQTSETKVHVTGSLETVGHSGESTTDKRFVRLGTARGIRFRHTSRALQFDRDRSFFTGTILIKLKPALYIRLRLSSNPSTGTHGQLGPNRSPRRWSRTGASGVDDGANESTRARLSSRYVPFVDLISPTA